MLQSKDNYFHLSFTLELMSLNSLNHLIPKHFTELDYEILVGFIFSPLMHLCVMNESKLIDTLYPVGNFNIMCTIDH